MKHLWRILKTDISHYFYNDYDMFFTPLGCLILMIIGWGSFAIVATTSPDEASWLATAAWCVVCLQLTMVPFLILLLATGELLMVALGCLLLITVWIIVEVRIALLWLIRLPARVQIKW